MPRRSDAQFRASQRTGKYGAVVFKNRTGKANEIWVAHDQDIESEPLPASVMERYTESRDE